MTLMKYLILPKTSLSYEELLKVFHKVYDELKKIDKRYSSLQKEHILFTNKFDTSKLYVTNIC